MTALKVLLAVLIVGVAMALGFWLLPNEPAEARRVEVEPLELSVDAGALPAPVAVPSQPLTEPLPISEALCPVGMAWVEGEYCPAGFLGKHGCRVSAPAVGVCVDRFEYPNQAGVFPGVMATFAEAEAACGVEGKRLCRDAEWTLACRETLRLTDCQFGAGKREFSRERLWDPTRTSEELSQIDGRRRSESSRCVSRWGIYDLPGNLEEWVSSEAANGYDAALKGGHFNKSSIGCERSVYVRQVNTRSPYIGFRCCSDPLVEPPRD